MTDASPKKTALPWREFAPLVYLTGRSEFFRIPPPLAESLILSSAGRE